MNSKLFTSSGDWLLAGRAWVPLSTSNPGALSRIGTVVQWLLQSEQSLCGFLCKLLLSLDVPSGVYCIIPSLCRGNRLRKFTVFHFRPELCPSGSPCPYVSLRLWDFRGLAVCTMSPLATWFVGPEVVTMDTTDYRRQNEPVTEGTQLGLSNTSGCGSQKKQ